MWNIVIPSFIILGTSQRTAAIISLLFCISQLTTIKFPHLVRVRALRIPTYIATATYFTVFAWLSATYPNGPRWAKDVILVGPAYLAFVVVWRTWFPTKKILGARITDVPTSA